MTLADSQQQRMLERLRRAGDQPTALAELRANGIDFPAAVLSELELNGYSIERVHDHGRLIGVRLLEPHPPRHPPHTRGTDGHGEPATDARHDSQVPVSLIGAHHTVAHRHGASQTPQPKPMRVRRPSVTIARWR